MNLRKVAIIGCGFVGSSIAFALMQSKLYSEMVLIDVNRAKAEGEALDISDGLPYASPMNIYAGDYADLGCQSVLNPGTVIGQHSQIYPLSMVRGVVPENSIYKAKDNIVVKEKR